MRNYRIRKSRGKYYIEVEKTEIKKSGILWWRKTIVIKDYVCCAEDGCPLFYVHFAGLGYSSPPLNSFKTLEEAKEKIKLFNTPDEIVYP